MFGTLDLCSLGRWMLEMERFVKAMKEWKCPARLPLKGWLLAGDTGAISEAAWLDFLRGTEGSKACAFKPDMVLGDRDEQSLCNVPAVLLLRPVPSKAPAKTKGHWAKTKGRWPTLQEKIVSSVCAGRLKLLIRRYEKEKEKSKIREKELTSESGSYHSRTHCWSGTVPIVNTYPVFLCVYLLS